MTSSSARKHAAPGSAPDLPAVPEPSFAERAHTLVYLGRMGSLSTLSLKQPGFPFGSVMPYRLDIMADRLNSLAVLSLKFYGYGAGLFIGFCGIASILLGYLMFRSGYFPNSRWLMALGGVGFVVSNFAFVLAPAYASSVLLLPAIISVFALTVWLLVKGVDVSRWQEKVAMTRLS